MAQQDDRDGQGKAQPELVAEHGDRVAGVLVVPTWGVVMPVTNRRPGRRCLFQVLGSLCDVLLMVRVVIHDAATR